MSEVPAEVLARYEQELRRRRVRDDDLPMLLDLGADFARAIVAEASKGRNGNGSRPKQTAAAPVPPHDLDAEESVLGGMLLSPIAIDAVSPLLAAADFYRPSHGCIYEAALGLHGRGEPVDGITVVGELERRGTLAVVADGAEAVHRLAALVPAASNAAHYARRVAELARRRRLADVLARVRSGALDPTVDVDQTIAVAREALAHEEILDSAGTTPFGGLTHDEALAQELPLERYLVDGLIPAGTVGVIAGVPEVGKSWVAQAIAVRCARGAGDVLGFKVARPARVGYFWSDDSTREELERIRLFEAAHNNPAGLPLHWFLNVGLQLPRDFARLRATIETHGLELAVADSFYNLAAEIDLKDAGAEQIVAALKQQVADPTGCTVLLVDHMPWATDSNRQRLRSYGGVFKNAATRFGIYIDAAGDKLHVEVRGNNITGFRKRAAYFDHDTLELRLVEATDHDDNVERRAEQALALLDKRAESLTTSSIRKELGGRENITDEALTLLLARAEVCDHGRDGGPWSGTKGAARYWIASVHAASRGIGTSAQLFGPRSAEVRPQGPEEEPRPGPSIGAEVSPAEFERLARDHADIAEGRA